jgi:hypothetical protein
MYSSLENKRPQNMVPKKNLKQGKNGKQVCHKVSGLFKKKDLQSEKV